MNINFYGGLGGRIISTYFVEKIDDKIGREKSEILTCHMASLKSVKECVIKSDTKLPIFMLPYIYGYSNSLSARKISLSVSPTTYKIYKDITAKEICDKFQYLLRLGLRKREIKADDQLRIDAVLSERYDQAQPIRIKKNDN